MRRWHVFALAFSFLALALSRTSPADIVIGEYGSMTGSQATFGISTDDGVKLAVKECNAAGGINGQQIQLVSYDDQGQQSGASTAVTRLIEQDHVVAIIGEVASSLSLAGGQQAQRLGVPMISPSSTNPRVTAIGDMISRVCFIDSFQGYVGASFAKDKLGFSKAAILYDRSQAYSTGLRGDFKKAFEEIGGTVVDEEAYASADNDYSAQLTAIQNANPQFIYVPGYYTQVVNIARQARQLGLNCPLIGGDGWVSDKLKDAGHALDGCYFSDHYSKDDDRPQVKEFLKKFEAEYSQDPDSMAALGYDAANLLFDAMKRAKSLSGSDLAAAINSTKNFDAVTGTITIDDHRNAKKGAVIQKLDNGDYSFFARVEPPQQFCVNPLAHTLLQTLTNAIAVGSLYALIALGYTLVFGILKFINFAHGDVFALGAWLTWKLATAAQNHHPFDNPVVMAVTVPVGAMFLCALVGFCIEFFAYKPLRNAPRLNVLITAIGVSLLLENAGQLYFGAQPQEVPLLVPDKVLATVIGVRIHLVDVAVVATALSLMVAMDWLVYHTRLGAAMRAVSFNVNTAALMGIRVNRIISITFIIGSGLAGAAGFLFAMKYPQLQQTSASVWLLLGMKAFIAAVVGGIGNVRGAVLGGLLIGLIEFFGVQYLSSDYRDVYVFLVLIIVLLVRPTGILGNPTAEKV